MMVIALAIVGVACVVFAAGLMFDAPWWVMVAGLALFVLAAGVGFVAARQIGEEKRRSCESDGGQYVDLYRDSICVFGENVRVES